MSITPENIPQHELVGLAAHVVKSSDPGQTCTRGVIRSESREMIGIESEHRVIMVHKKACVFDITLPSGARVRVDGRLLQGRPEDRMKKRINRSW
jgi:ribonuclease P protein subunit POP4